MTLRLTRTVSLAALMAAAPLAAHAAEPEPTETTTPTCQQGQVYDSEQSKCVDQQSGILPDAALTDNAFALAKEGRFDEARTVLALRLGGHDVMSLTALGYITRKEGDARASINYYLQAIAADPVDTRVREYLGEAYVTLGRMDDAQRQLDRIAALAGMGSSDYRSLAAMINAVL